MKQRDSKEQKIYLKTIYFLVFQDKKYILKKRQAHIVKIMSNMKTENENDFFEIEIYDGDIKNELPISLFEEIEAELCDRLLPSSLFEEIEAELCDILLHDSSPEEDDEIDSATEFIKNIVEKVKDEFEALVEDGNQKKFLNTLTKVFTIILSVKADNADKIIKIVKLTVSTLLKFWSEQN